MPQISATYCIIATPILAVKFSILYFYNNATKLCKHCEEFLLACFFKITLFLTSWHQMYIIIVYWCIFLSAWTCPFFTINCKLTFRSASIQWIKQCACILYIWYKRKGQSLLPLFWLNSCLKLLCVLPIPYVVHCGYFVAVSKSESTTFPFYNDFFFSIATAHSDYECTFKFFCYCLILK